MRCRKWWMAQELIHPTREAVIFGHCLGVEAVDAVAILVGELGCEVAGLGTLLPQKAAPPWAEPTKAPTTRWR
jgi:hypothetical protein